MSRIGRLPVPVPSGVDVTIDGSNLTVKGPKGQLALDVGAGLGQVGDPVDRDQPLELGADLVDHRRRPVGDDGDPAERVAFRDVGHGQAVDVVAAGGEQPGDLGKDPGLVVDHDGQDVAFRHLLADLHGST